MPISSFNPGGSSWSQGFYNPNSNYGNEEWMNAFPDWQGSQAWLNQVESAPAGAWGVKLAELGLGGLDDRSEYARGLLSRVNQGWESAKLKSPGLRLWDFMNTQNIGQIIGSSSPDVRGETGRHPASTRWQQRLQ